MIKYIFNTLIRSVIPLFIWSKMESHGKGFLFPFKKCRSILPKIFHKKNFRQRNRLLWKASNSFLKVDIVYYHTKGDYSWVLRQNESKVNQRWWFGGEKMISIIKLMGKVWVWAASMIRKSGTLGIKINSRKSRV